ncbi:MAG TPA: EAL domain-containing protein [Acetobacteraceae bacterium]|nr:EAL domain-containing protein [Acetobacteraceae bacterium]
MLPRLVKLAALMGRSRAGHLSVACGLVVALAAAATLPPAASRSVAVADAGANSHNLSIVTAEETGREFHGVAQDALGRIRHMHGQGVDSPEQFGRKTVSLPVNQDPRRHTAAMPGISAVLLAGRRGTTMQASWSWPTVPTDVSDREDFLVFAGKHPPTSFIKAPPSRRRTDRWTQLPARSIAAPGRKLPGIVGGSLHLGSFEDPFARSALRNASAAAVFRSDGVRLAQHPHLDPDSGRQYRGTPGFRRLAGSADHGILRHSGGVSAALAGWRIPARSLFGVTALAELIVAGIVVLGVRQLRAQERLVAAAAVAMQAEAVRAQAMSKLAVARRRDTGEREAHLQAQRFDVALSNMIQGLMMVDNAGRLLVVNRRFTELFGLPADTARLAGNYAEIVELMVGCGNVAPRDTETMRAWRKSAIANSGRSNFTWELADGRVLMVTHQTIQDGWLTTYEDATQRRRADARMDHMAKHDALTDLPNRVQFRESLEAAMTYARRGNLVALLCLDLDQFKAVNDTLGHPAGDALLQAVASRLTERIHETDIAARLGGDEFAVVQAPIDRPAEAADFAERLIAMLDEPFEVHGHQVIIGTSIGIAFAPQDGLDADELLKNADLALHRAKSDGRGAYRLFHAEMDAEMQARRLLDLDLRHALRGGQFELHYQPVMDLRTQAVSGFEALLRWKHPERGMVPPSQFIPLAEEIGAIVPIGEWVLRQACVAAASWPDALCVSVNLSPMQFNSRNLVAAVAAALREARLAPARLQLEITETVMLQDTEATLATLHDLRNLGVSIAMDDFGTGYSSLSYLRRFPFDRIKIDQSFVREIGKRRDCGAIIRAVIALSHEFGMATTAEGVETREQLCALALAGCSDIQRYLFSRPVPLRDIPAMLGSMPLVADLLPQASLVA